MSKTQKNVKKNNSRRYQESPKNSFQMKARKKSKDDQNRSDILWNRWKEKWETEVKSLPLPEDQKVLFEETFKTAHHNAENRINKCKKKNIWIKTFYVIVLCVMIIVDIAFLAFYCRSFPPKIDLKFIFAFEFSLVLIIILFTLVVSKWLDIKKYQETYSRHRRFKCLRETEMLRFLLDINGYENHKDGNHVRMFMNRILKIEQKNIEKLCDNLDEKEKNIREGLELLFVKKE